MQSINSEWEIPTCDQGKVIIILLPESWNFWLPPRTCSYWVQRGLISFSTRSLKVIVNVLNVCFSANILSVFSFAKHSGRARERSYYIIFQRMCLECLSSELTENFRRKPPILNINKLPKRFVGYMILVGTLCSWSACRKFSLWPRKFDEIFGFKTQLYLSILLAARCSPK